MGTAQASDYLENKIVDHLYRSAVWAKPTACWIALFTSAPNDAGSGVEVSAGGYARVNLPPSDANWTATQGGTGGVSNGNLGMTSNAVAITFPVPTGDWGTVGWFAHFDAPSGGNMLVWDVLQAPRTILNGDPAPQFAAGSLQITVQ